MGPELKAGAEQLTGANQLAAVTLVDFANETRNVAHAKVLEATGSLPGAPEDAWTLQVLMKLEEVRPGTINDILERVQNPPKESRAFQILGRVFNRVVEIVTPLVSSETTHRQIKAAHEAQETQIATRAPELPEPLRNLETDLECMEQIRQVVCAEEAVGQVIKSLQPLRTRLDIMKDAQAYFAAPSSKANESIQVYLDPHHSWRLMRLSTQDFHGHTVITITRDQVNTFFDEGSDRADSEMGLLRFIEALEIKQAEVIPNLDQVRSNASHIITESLAAEFEQRTTDITPEQLAKVVLASTLAHQARVSPNQRDVVGKFSSTLDVAGETSKYLMTLIFSNPHKLAVWRDRLVVIKDGFWLRKNQSSDDEIPLIDLLMDYVWYDFPSSPPRSFEMADVLVSTSGDDYAKRFGELGLAGRPAKDLKKYFLRHEHESLYALFGHKYKGSLHDMPELMDEETREKELINYKSRLNEYMSGLWNQSASMGSGEFLIEAAEAVNDSTLHMQTDSEVIRQIVELEAKANKIIDPLAAQAELWALGIRSAEDFAKLVGEMAVEGLKLNALAFTLRVTDRYSALLANLVNQIYGSELEPADIFRVVDYATHHIGGRSVIWPIFGWAPRKTEGAASNG